VPELEGLLFFAQLISELLFDYSLDTYKLPALNSRLLTLELLYSIKEYEANFLKLGALKPIVNELQDRLHKDPVIKEIMTRYYIDYLSMLKDDTSVPEIKNRVQFLNNKISESFFPTCKTLLREAVLGSREKEKITRLTRIFLIELINRGHSSEYIYFESDKFFFEGTFPSRISDPELIDKFFDLFSLEKKQYIVMYRAGRNIRTIRDYAPSLDLEVIESVPELSFRGKSEVVEEFLQNNEEYPLFLVVKDIKSHDRDKAREEADNRLFLVDSLAKYHVHRRNLRIGDNALIYSHDQTEFGIVRKPRSPVMKRPDRPFENLASLIQKTVSTITTENLDEESIERLTRAFWLHNTGIRASAPQSQLLEFWSAIEVLFPPRGPDTDRIVQIVDCMVPFIASEYGAKLAADLYSSIKRAGSPEALEILEEIAEGDNPIEKCLALISIKANEPIRERFYSLYEWHPLLRNRIFYLTKRFSSADLVLKTLQAHAERVSWQIGRIYRARNLIIHSGKSLPYINILVENLHSYLDRVLDLLNEEISRSNHPITLDQITLEIKLQTESHLRNLKNLGKLECTAENYKQILFGN